MLHCYASIRSGESNGFNWLEGCEITPVWSSQSPEKGGSRSGIVGQLHPRTQGELREGGPVAMNVPLAPEFHYHVFS